MQSMGKFVNQLHAVLFDLTEDLRIELSGRLQSCAVSTETIERNQGSGIQAVIESRADIIFCSAEANVVGYLRTARPLDPIVVVSRHAEVTHWLDAIEAGATDYCAAPFETSQVKWILESAMRSVRVKVEAAAA